MFVLSVDHVATYSHIRALSFTTRIRHVSKSSATSAILVRDGNVMETLESVNVGVTIPSTSVLVFLCHTCIVTSPTPSNDTNGKKLILVVALFITIYLSNVKLNFRLPSIKKGTPKGPRYYETSKILCDCNNASHIAI